MTEITTLETQQGERGWNETKQCVRMSNYYYVVLESPCSRPRNDSRLFSSCWVHKVLIEKRKISNHRCDIMIAI